MACVALAAMRSVLIFPDAIGSVTLFGIVVFRERLYSDATLQLSFAAANLYGWRNWNRSRASAGRIRGRADDARLARGMDDRGVERNLGLVRADSLADRRFLFVLGREYRAAQILMARRKLENWLIWIAVDVASVPLYLAKHLWAFAGLCVLYLGLAIWGFSSCV